MTKNMVTYFTIPQGLYSSIKQHVLIASAIPPLQVIGYDQEGGNALTAFSQICSIVMLLIIHGKKKVNIL